ncbi:MAG: HlyD family secretion protein [Caulobacteraceae bacterium]|nr:HlyD family secretion protein [Caulobacteraceae bacterium]
MNVPYALRVLVTLAVVVVAAFVATWLWRRYQIEPWTRDGRVRADVVEVAPDVTGLVTAVQVRDNQVVKRGQPLFVLDRPRFELALAQAEAAVQTQRVALDQARREDRRNRGLGDLVSAEATEQGAARVAQLAAALSEAQANRDTARLNLERTVVVAPVDGVAANVALEPGDYASAGHPVLGIVATASLHVDGYFEETKLPRIHVGDPVSVRLMGDPKTLWGHVESLAPGIEDRERAASANLLPNVNPTFSWVRLAQRVPVRIALDRVPADVRLLAGRTATVTVYPRLAQAHGR